MHENLKSRLIALDEIIKITRERNVEVRDKADQNINSLRLISESLLKLEAEMLQKQLID
tara:strand:- start:401 stop:577 length:177 start_codon:yes stop_codon:yes gene_type:complete